MAVNVDTAYGMNDKSNRSLGELFADLTRETRELITQEIALARTEMSQKVSAFTREAAMVAAGGALLYAGLLVFIAFIAVALAALGLPWWAATLVTAILVLGIGGILLMAGLKAMKRQSLAPNQTIDTLKENAEWIRQHAR